MPSAEVSSPHPSVSGAQPGREEIVLVDEDGHAAGTADKLIAHGAATPQHLAFSCYVFDRSRRLLLTRRALDKRSFPGVWTNSVCGHPALGESMEDAVRRRAAFELGLALDEVRLIDGAFAYRAEMDGLVEDELCPVYGAVVDVNTPMGPCVEEVAATEWVPWESFAADVLSDRRTVSPWCALQVPRLTELGDDPLAWPADDPRRLPPAATEIAAGSALHPRRPRD